VIAQRNRDRSCCPHPPTRPLVRLSSLGLVSSRLRVARPLLPPSSRGASPIDRETKRRKKKHSRTRRSQHESTGPRHRARLPAAAARTAPHAHADAAGAPAAARRQEMSHTESNHTQTGTIARYIVWPAPPSFPRPPSGRLVSFSLRPADRTSYNRIRHHGSREVCPPRPPAAGSEHARHEECTHTHTHKSTVLLS
jgi:hypothetical protein